MIEKGKARRTGERGREYGQREEEGASVAENKGRQIALPGFPLPIALLTMFTWASLTNVTNASVRRQISSNPRAFLNLEPDLALQVPALDLPYRCDELVHDLVAAGTTSATNEFLAGTFGRAVEATGQRFQETFIRTMQGIAPTFEDSDALQEMGRVLKVRYEEDFKAAIARIRYSLLAEVAAHRSRMLATTTHERGAFSDETTAILQAVYERQPNVSRREKQALSERTGLSLTQVATWVRSLCSRSSLR